MSRSNSQASLASTLHLKLATPIGLANAEFNLHEDWNSKSSNHRMRIREAAADRLRQFSTSEQDIAAVLDLNRFPRLTNHALSISHCPNLGGFVLVPNAQLAVGFDIEISSRISIPVATRVLPHSSEHEARLMAAQKTRQVSTGNLPAMLWAAKESAIKSFGHAFPDKALNFTNVELVEVKFDRDFGATFSARHGDSEARGLVEQLNERTYALTVCFPK